MFYYTLIGLLACQCLVFGLFFPEKESTVQQQETVEVQYTPEPDYIILAAVQPNQSSVPSGYWLINISPDNGHIVLTNLPQDLTLPCGGTQKKIADCYAYAGMMQVAESFATTNVNARGYLCLIADQLTQWIDTFGTYTFKVPMAINQMGDYGMVAYKIAAGEQQMDGSLTTGYFNYCSFTNYEKDLLALQMGQAALKQYLPTITEDFSQIMCQLINHTESNLTQGDILLLQKKLTTTYQRENFEILIVQQFGTEDFSSVMKRYYGLAQ